MKPLSPTATALAAALFLSACDKPEPTTYTIPKEERVATVLNQAPQPQPETETKQMQVLPGMEEAAEAAPEFTYTVPNGWEEFAPQSIRKANFRVNDESGSAEIAVTVFPGSVGSTLNNINRWRGQIGLDPIQEEAIGQMTRPYVISAHKGMLVSLEGPAESILAGILDFHGSTWFFKMQGSTGTVANQARTMETFLSSVFIEDHHH